MAEVTYYYNSTYPPLWDNDPSYMVDNILTNFASTASTDDAQLLSGNTCPGIDLGTITKVELRAYGHGDGNDRIDLTSYFSGRGYGDEHELTMPSSANWSVYIDITNDTNAPSPWTWTDIVNINLQRGPPTDGGVVFTKVGKGNTMYCSKVEIRVTFTPVGPPEKVTQYLAGHDCPEFPHEMDLLSDKLPCPPPY